MPEENPSQATAESVAQPPEIRRHENFESWYANNIQYEPNDWDLRLVFGIFENRAGKVGIEQHTAMSISWPQVKIMLYFLQIQLAIYEKMNGKIKIPLNSWPVEPTPPSEELKASNPGAEVFYEIVKRIRDQFIATVQ